MGFPKIGMPLFIIHFRLGFSIINCGLLGLTFHFSTQADSKVGDTPNNSLSRPEWNVAISRCDSVDMAKVKSLDHGMGTLLLLDLKILEVEQLIVRT